MQINTRDFGAVELDEAQVVTFRSPIFGYEHLERFALLDGEVEGLQWLQAVDQAETCFIVLDPEAIGLPYHPDVGRDTTELLRLKGTPTYRLIAIIPDNFHDTMVNLKSPIVLNMEEKAAAQVILEADLPIRMRLFQTQDEAGLFVNREEQEC